MQKTLAEPVLTLLVHQSIALLQQTLNDFFEHRTLEEAVNSALRTELSQLMLPLGTVAREPEDPGEGHACIGPHRTLVGASWQDRKSV